MYFISLLALPSLIALHRGVYVLVTIIFGQTQIIQEHGGGWFFHSNPIWINLTYKHKLQNIE